MNIHVQVYPVRCIDPPSCHSGLTCLKYQGHVRCSHGLPYTVRHILIVVHIRMVRPCGLELHGRLNIGP